MDVVVDSNVLAGIRPYAKEEDGLSARVRHRMIRVVVDKDMGLVDEWKRTCKPEMIESMIIKWKDSGGLVLIRPIDKIPKDTLRRLVAIGFRNQTIDKLIIRIAANTTDKIAITNDGDFWHGKATGGQRAGDASGRIAKLLRESLHITILTMTQMVEEVELG
jgi:hypothetical protein